MVPRGRITLPVEMWSAPLVAHHFMKFLVVDHKLAYYRVLGRPALKDFWVVTSIHYLCMKFPTEHGIATVRGDQMGTRVCYLNFLRKFEPRTVNVIITEADNEADMDIEMLDVSEQGHTSKQEEDVDMVEAPEEGHPLDELDPRIIESKPNTTLIEEPTTPRSERRSDELPEKKPGCLRLEARRYDGNRPKDQLSPLNINSSYVPHRQKRRALNSERYKACPKDSFPLPRIDQLVDSTVGHELLSFMDAYSGYNQIPMFGPDEESTSFITDRGLYYYKMMPFKLKNTRATYQMLVNMMLTELIDKSMEVYVDDMLIKSLQAKEHVSHLDEAF
ncbi:uncharacterized protein LOC111406782 [Olea europaea var. sylvestris]|uniref:uncharacterized protein LOC111406782 n=1 Tax=Olea europaea var. sylvestris TaxID=158386 RepID=UPI000C1D1611|nr:uncharacterized protein LOC111406782 [Olea europaea var. sylvestris]